MNKIRAPYLSVETIRKKVEKFRNEHNSCKNIPIDMEELLELELQLDIITLPLLYSECDIEAMLLSDGKSIIIDKDIYMHACSNKMRFTLAHEVGHLILHKSLWEKYRLSNVEEFIKFHKHIDEVQYRYLERHASEFAGRLLVPFEELVEKTREALETIPSEIDISPKDALPSLAPTICRYFHVSDKVIEIRLSRENIDKHLTG